MNPLDSKVEFRHIPRILFALAGGLCCGIVLPDIVINILLAVLAAWVCVVTLWVAETGMALDGIGEKS